MRRLASTRDLLPSERRFLKAFQRLGHGRFEYIRIEHGELVLDPWPSTVWDVKFASTDTATPMEPSSEFGLKRQIAELFAYVRSVEAGEIRTLVIKGGLPFSMQVESAEPIGRSFGA